jgi:hypothetical protein
LHHARISEWCIDFIESLANSTCVKWKMFELTLQWSDKKEIEFCAFSIYSVSVNDVSRLQRFRYFIVCDQQLTKLNIIYVNVHRIS